MGLGDRLGDEVSAQRTEPLGQSLIFGRRTLTIPLSAILIKHDNVALVRASVEVLATAPGMLATQ
jgi:hypothetical protein